MTFSMFFAATSQAVPTNWWEYLALKEWLFAFIGTAMGIWYARRQEISRNKQRHLALLQYLITTLRFNLDRLRQMISQFTGQPPQMPNYTLDDISIMQALAAERDLISDRQLYNDIYWQRFQLLHINAKLAQLHVQHSVVSAAGPHAIFQQSLASCLLHCQTTEQEISKLVGRLERLAQ